MKILITLACVVAVMTTQAQYNIKEELPSHILSFVSGAADGVSEKIKFHKLGAGSPFWDMKTSWQRKWKDGKESNGEKFFGSSTLLVFVTDGYHLMRMIQHTTMATSLVFHLGEKKKWYVYLIDGVLHMITNRIGFHLTYNVIFKK